MPYRLLPEIRLPSPAADPPIVATATLYTSMPVSFPSAALPSAVVPILLPLMVVLPYHSLMPSCVLPEIRLPAPAAEPPTVAAAAIDAPTLLAIAPVPAALVPM